MRTALNFRPDLVLLDLYMPGMDGAELLEWIRAQTRLDGLPCFVITGSTRAEDYDRVAEWADGYQPKPRVTEGWENRARTILRLFRARRMCSQNELASFEAVCASMGLNSVAIQSDSQEQHVVTARASAVARLKAMGWPAATIARILSRSVRTVQRVRPRA